jgi:tetratricopeptide (TPR) repeat protein
VLKQEHPHLLNTLTCLLADNSYPGLIAKAHELEVDVFVLRPFSIEAFSEKIIAKIKQKIAFEKSHQLYDEGKFHFSKNQIERAVDYFMQAIEEGFESSNPYYYLYECLVQQKNEERAVSFLEKGLKAEPKNYLCLRALFYHHFRKLNIPEAYSYLSRLIEDYPLDPHMIPDFTKVLIANQKHADIIKYCDQLTSWGNLDHLEQNKDNTKHGEDEECVSMKIRTEMAASLVVAIRYLWQNGQKLKFEEILNKALRLSENGPKIVSAVGKLFYEMNRIPEAKKVLYKISTEQWTQEAFVTDFFLDMAENKRAEDVLLKGMHLLQKGIHDKKIYEAVIKKSVELNRPISIIEKIYIEAETHFPDNCADLRTLYKKSA